MRGPWLPVGMTSVTSRVSGSVRKNMSSCFFALRWYKMNVPCFLFRACQPEVTFRVFYFAHTSMTLRSVFFISRSLTEYLPELTFRVFYFAATSSLDPDVTCFFIWARLRRAIPPFCRKILDPPGIFKEYLVLV